MRIRFYHAKILTMHAGEEIFDGEVWVNDDRIEGVFTQDAAKRRMQEREMADFGREIDCCGNLLMPGFKNAHTHSPMTFLRSMADDMPLEDWLHNKVFPMEERLDADAIYHFGKLAVLEYLSSGITAIFDMYLQPRIMAQVAVDTGMRTVLTSGLNLFTSSVQQMSDEYETLNVFHPLVSYQLGFHAEYTCDKQLLVEAASISHAQKAPVFCHLAETRAEVKNCLERYGKTSVAFLCDLGMFDYGGAGFHMVYLTDEEIDLLKTYRIGVVTNPASNLKLASGIAPIRTYVDQGISVGIGTDGAASNNALDMFREMYLVSSLSKLREMDAASLDAGAVLAMAASEGARIMRLDDCDCLAEGKYADLIMLDLHAPNMQPIHKIEKNIVYAGAKSNVKLTMIGGKILYEDGKYYLSDRPEDIYRACEAALQRMRK